MKTAFKHRCVRDLAWVIASPPLVSGDYLETRWWSHQKCLQELNDCLPALKALDKNPAPLIKHLDSLKSARLGLRFEALVAFWLARISPNHALLARNIQLFEQIFEQSGATQRRTLGEIDFIIKEQSSGKIIHLEVAVKFYLGFYLGLAAPQDPYRWFGTNLDDQLGKKLEHLKQRQTQLSKRYPELIKFRIDERHCLLKGRLFYPEGRDEPAPSGVSPNHLRGRWKRAALLPQQTQHSQRLKQTKRLIPLKKEDWFAEFTHQDIVEILARQQTTSIDKPVISESITTPVCFLRVEKQDSYSENERIFYVPENFIFP